MSILGESQSIYITLYILHTKTRGYTGEQHKFRILLLYTRVYEVNVLYIYIRHAHNRRRLFI